MNEWVKQLRVLSEAQMGCILVTVVSVRGSAPREPGTRMIVTRDLTLGTIGGGRLEFEVTATARTMLGEGARNGTWRRIVLGAGIGQCCGGIVELLLEPVVPGHAGWIAPLSEMLRSGPCLMIRDAEAIAGNPAERALVSDGAVWGRLHGEPLGREESDYARAALRDTHGDVLRKSFVKTVKKDVLMEVVRPYGARIMLFGAGHVGRALMHVLHHVPYDITWVDSRRDCFPAEVPDNVTVLQTDDAERAVAEAQSGTMFIVMTHSHPLDLAICASVLMRGDFRYLGLIGSRSKRRRFESRLRSLGLQDEALKRLACPIGSAAIQSKHPAFIAVSIAAEILTVATAGEFGSKVECVELDGAHAVGAA